MKRKKELKNDLDKNKKKVESEVDLPINRDYNSITNFYLKTLNLNKGNNIHKILEYLPLIFSILLIIFPFIKEDILKSFPFIKHEILKIFPSHKEDILIIFSGHKNLITVFGGILLFFYPSIINFSKNCNKKVDSSKLYAKLTNEQIKFISNEKIIDEMIEYLKNSDKSIEELISKILGFSVTLYTLYSHMIFINDKFKLINYILLTTGYTVLGITTLSKSTERLYFLNLLEHIKVSNELAKVTDS